MPAQVDGPARRTRSTRKMAPTRKESPVCLTKQGMPTSVRRPRKNEVEVVAPAAEEPVAVARPPAKTAPAQEEAPVAAPARPKKPAATAPLPPRRGRGRRPPRRGREYQRRQPRPAPPPPPPPVVAVPPVPKYLKRAMKQQLRYFLNQERRGS